MRTGGQFHVRSIQSANEDGSLTFYCAIDTGVAGDNGLATPGLVLDSAGKVTTAYAGDLKGNVWKFNLNSSTASDWSVANSGLPFFKATSAAGVAQPITAPITMRPSTIATISSINVKPCRCLRNSNK